MRKETKKRWRSTVMLLTECGKSKKYELIGTIKKYEFILCSAPFRASTKASSNWPHWRFKCSVDRLPDTMCGQKIGNMVRKALYELIPFEAERCWSKLFFLFRLEVEGLEVVGKFSIIEKRRINKECLYPEGDLRLRERYIGTAPGGNPCECLNTEAAIYML